MKQREESKLIAPLSPPPPPPKSRLSKDSRLKYLFKASSSRLKIHRRLPWKWNTPFLLSLPANLFLTARPNSGTNGIRSRSLWLLTPILIILAVIISSSCSPGAETQSSQSEITKLTVTINSIDYTITFDANNAATVTIPYVSNLPTEITVKTAAISDKAAGLAAGDTLNISSGKADITITAEDGSTTTHVLNIAIEDPLLAAVQARSSVTVGSLQPDNYWANIFPFSIKVSDASLAGEYRLAVRLASEDEPDAAEIRSSAAAIVRNLSTNSINVLMSFDMDTDLFDAATDWGQAWGDGSDLLNKAKAARLQPETAYKLYAVRLTGDDTVHSVSSFTTDAELTPADLDTLGITEQSFFNFPLNFTDSTGALGHVFTIRQNEPFLFPVGVVNPSTALTIKINSKTLSACDNTRNDCLPIVDTHNIFFQTLAAASDKRIFPSIVGGRGFVDSLVSNSNERLTYQLFHSSTSYSFNMVIE